MIVVDSSAVVAILFGEPLAEALLARLAMDHDRVMSVASYFETGTVLAGRRLSDRLLAIDDMDRFLDEAGIALVPVDVAQARLALRAHILFGRGMGHRGKPGPVLRCTSIASPMTCSVNDSARSIRNSVFPVVLRPFSVRIKNKSLTHGPWVGGHGARRAAGSVHALRSCGPLLF